MFLPELTLSRYPADTLPEGVAADAAEDLLTGPTFALAARAARAHGVHVHASLYERADSVRTDDTAEPAAEAAAEAIAASGAADGSDGRGLNTAILVDPAGRLVARTRKLHIPVTAGYYEDKYFRPGPADEAYPVVALDDPQVEHGECFHIFSCGVRRA